MTASLLAGASGYSNTALLVWEVLVRTQAGGGPELGGEMHGRETSRRGKIGEAYLDGETDDVSHSREQ